MVHVLYILCFQQGGGQVIGIFPVLFTQGVNEWQMLSNIVGTNSLQATVNAKSLRDLMSYCNLCAANERTKPDSDGRGKH